MPAVAITVLIAFFIIGGALACLGIGLLLTGRSKIKPGACGRDPNKIREEGCGTEVSCQLCDKNEAKKTTENPKQHVSPEKDA